MPTVTRRELTLAILWSAFIAVLTSGPYVAGSLEANGRYFSGLISAVDDGNVYLQWIRQASEGHWTLSNQYSADEGEGGPFNVFLFVLGRAAGLFGLTPPQVFSAARVLAACLCLVAFYLLAAAFSANPTFRWSAMFLVSLSGGFGWLVDMLYPNAVGALQPIDYGPRWVYQPEAITFLSILTNPLFAFSLALICLSLLCALRCTDTGRVRWAVAGGCCVMVLGSAHTYDLPVVGLTIFVWLALAAATKRLPLGRAALMLVIVVAMALPPGLWQWHVMQSNPLYRAKAQTPTLSPPYYDYALGYGLPWVLAIVGAVWLLRTRSLERRRLIYLVPWLLIASALLYAPVPWQRKMAEGLHFPICLLAATTLVCALPDWLARRRPGKVGESRVALVVALLVLLSLPSNLLFYADCFHNVRTNNADFLPVLMPPVYLEPGEHAAMCELAARTTEHDVVISSPMMGNYIPVFARCRVVAGHWGESTYALPKASGGWQRLPWESYAVPLVLGFFGPQSSPEDRALILRRFRVTYVFCGPFENALYAARTPAESRAGLPAEDSAAQALRALPFLHEVYAKGGVSLFQVTPRAELTEFPEHESAESGTLQPMTP